MNEDLQSKNYPTASAIRGFSSAALEYYRTQVSQNPASMAALHNAYVDYTIMLLQFATGTRPTNAIFSDPMCIDLEAGLILVSDKVVIESRAFRLLPLTSIAVGQLEYLRRHLEVMAVKLRTKRDSTLVAYSIERLLSGVGSQKIPFCFHLRDDLTGTVDITKGHLDNLYTAALDMPSNISRTILATESEESGMDGTDIEILLGHNESVGLDDPFGRAAMRSPIEYLGASRSILESSFEGMQWKVIEGPFARKYKVLNIPSTTDEFTSPHDVEVFGYQARTIRRQNLVNEIESLVGQAVDAIFPDKIPPQPDKVSLTKLRDRVIASSKEENLSENWMLQVLYKRLTRDLKGRSWTAQLRRRYALEPESSPFGPRSLSSYIEAKAVRLRFYKYLDQQGRKTVEVDGATRLAELTMHIALSGAVCEASRLRQLWRGATEARLKIGDVEFIEIPFLREDVDESKDSKLEGSVTHRLVLDDFSKYLLFGLVRGVEKGDLSNLKANSVNAAVEKLGHLLEFQENPNKSIWKVIASYSHSLALFEKRGAYRELLFRHTPSRTLPLEAILRLTSQSVQTFDSPLQSVLKEKSAPGSKPPKEALARTPFATAAKAFRARYEEIVTAVEREVSSSENLSDDRKALLSHKVRTYQKNNEMPFAIQVMFFWCIRLCDERTVFGNKIVFGTVIAYTRLVLGIIIDHPEMREMEFWTTDQYEDFYLDLVENIQPGSGDSLPGRLMDFDAQVCSLRLRVTELDWSLVLPANPHIPDSIERRIDANIVTEAEYQASLDAILGMLDAPHTARFQIAMILILGFRFGLRWSEAFFLKVGDIQYSDDFAHIYINVRNNSLRELKSIAGRRRIPLIKPLSEQERYVFSILMRHAEVWRSESNDAFLMKNSDAIDGLITEWRAGRIINGLLKGVSGNKCLHFHHCRHTFASRLILVAFSNVDCPVYRHLYTELAGEEYFNAENLHEIWRPDMSDTRKLRAICTLMGHVCPTTTLGSYGHVFDALLFENRDEFYEKENLHFAAYVLGKPYSSLRKQRKRYSLRKAPESFKPLEYYYCGKGVFLQCSAATRLIKVGGLVSITKSQPFSLLQVHDLLVAFGRRRGRLHSGATWLVSGQEQTLLKLARDIETKSGYLRYGFFLQEHKTTKNEAGEESIDYRENYEEDVLLRGALSTLQSSIDLDSNDNMLSFVQVWIEAYSPEGPYLIFKTIGAAAEFVVGARKLGLSHIRWSLLLPGVKSDEVTRVISPEEFSDVKVFPSQVVRLLVKRGDHRETVKVGLRLQKHPGSSISREAMNRLLFTLSVWMENSGNSLS